MRLSVKNISAKYISIWVACALFIFLILLHILLNFNGLYGQDAYKYLQFSVAFTRYIHSGLNPEDIYFPILYSIFGSLINIVIPYPVLCLQLVSIGAYCLGFILLEKLIYLVFEPAKRIQISIYLFIFYAFSPYIFRFSLLVMSDMLAMVLCVLVFYFAFRYYHFCKSSDLYLLVLFFFAAGLTRNAAIVFLIVPASISLIRFIKNFRILQLVFIFGIIAIMLLPDYILRHRIFIFSQQNGHFELSYMVEKPTWSIANWLKFSFQSINGYQSYHQPNIIYVFYNIFHPAYLFCGFVFLIFLKRKDFRSIESISILFSILIYALFLAGFDSQNMRFLLLSFPFVLVLLYPGFERLTVFLYGKNKYVLVFLSALLCQLIFTAYSFASVYNANKNDRAIANVLHAFTGKTIYTFEQEGIIKAYEMNYKTINIWDTALIKIEPNSLMILNPDKVKSQFQGQVAARNLELIFRKTHPLLIQSFNYGIKLYLINS